MDQFLKPNLKFDYVPIKEVSIERLKTEKFIDTVSELQREKDVIAAGGFMIIRAKNYKGAEPFLYPKGYSNKDYNPKQHDVSDEYNNLFGIPNLKHHFKAQIHDQKCKQMQSQIFKWRDEKIYKTQKSAKEHFKINNNLNAASSKKRKKKKEKSNKQFEVITNKNGESLTQTQSGRIVKVHCNQQYYDQLDKLLDVNDDDSENENYSNSDTTNDDATNEPATKKRKLCSNEQTIQSKYQYPFLLKSCLPEPDDNVHSTGNGLRLEARNAYTKSTKTQRSSSYKYKYSYHERNKCTKHINRGFACIIQQVERKRKAQISTFWNEDTFKEQLSSSVYDGKSAEEIPLIFANYLKSAEIVQYAILDQDDVYHFESPLQLNSLSNFGPFKVLRSNEIMLGIQKPYVYIGHQHAFFPFHREDMNLFAVNHLLWGCHKLWYCIHPKDHSKVIAFIRKQYASDIDNECETPLQHKITWFDPYILLSMGIKVYFIRQQVGDIVVTPPGGIHGGLNCGPNMAASINFMTYDVDICWKPMLSAMLYYCHNFECNACISHAFLDVNRLAQRLRDVGDERVPSTNVIAPVMSISKTSVHFPKYKNEDLFISRSFTWNNRLSLRSRFINSFECESFENALSKDVVYPFYKMSDNQMRIYPIVYNGSYKHRRDELIFEPLYFVKYLFKDCAMKNYVSLKQILKDHGISCREWEQRKWKFDECAIRLALESDCVNIRFMYHQKKVSKPKEKSESTSLLSSAERRKRIKRKRVIADSDTDSD